MAGVKLKYALYDKKHLVSVDEVANGLACNCYCPACFCKLEAKQGDIREHHFAHYDKSECEGAIKAELHLITISLLNELKMIHLPPVTLNINGKQIYYKDAVLTNIVQVDEERNNNIPRIVVKFRSGKVLYIEVDVQHALDKAQCEKYKDNNQSAIQIQLNHEEIKDPVNAIGQKLSSNVSGKRWINNSQGEIVLQPLSKGTTYKNFVEKQEVFPFMKNSPKKINSIPANGIPVQKLHGEEFIMACPHNKGKRTGTAYCQNSCPSFIELVTVGEAKRIKCKDAPEFG